MNEVSVVPAPWLVPTLAIIAVSTAALLFGLVLAALWSDVCASDKARIRRRGRDILDVRRHLTGLRLSLPRGLARHTPGLFLALVGLAGTAHADEPEPVQLGLFAGRLITVNIDGTGALNKGDDLYVLRMVVAVPGPFGLRLGVRADATALSYIDPSNLDPASVRTGEVYAAASWSAKKGGWSFGPAAFTGALVPVQDALEWRMKSAWGAGARIGYGPSWAYAFVGKDAASDEVAGTGASPMRLIAPFNVQWKFLAGQGEIVTGPGGRFRFAAVVQIPNPWSE